MFVKDEICIFADFETTIDDPDMTEVWSAASITDKDPSDPKYVHMEKNISNFMNYLLNQVAYQSITVYFHNEKFDGSFIIYWLLKNRRFEPDYEYGPDGEVRLSSEKPWKMKNESFRYTISSKGQWYKIHIKHKGKDIVILDSLKLIPMSLKKAGKSFKTKHQKLEMEYSNHRPGDTLTQKEIDYIKNDVLVLKECMEYMFSQGIDTMTIGGACLNEFQKGYGKEDYEKLFPDVTQMKIKDFIGKGREEYNTNRTVDSFCRRSYHGGFCYVNPKYQGKVLEVGKNVTAISHVDANSHYPSQMVSDSGNYYPVGVPVYFKREQFESIKNTSVSKCYYFVRILTKFEIKEKMLPMLQIKDDPRFSKQRNEWLESSKGQYVDIVLTRTDYELFEKTYDSDTKILEGLAFKTETGLFDKYIKHWYSIKENATGAVRQIAKLMLNNLYGKFAASRDSSYKIAYIDKKKKCLRYSTVSASDKKPGYIPIGSAITSYARNRTITLAEEYYDDYVYSDTDSNVYTRGLDNLSKIPQHESKICYWKVESNSDKAVFVRQKTYIEHVVAEDGKMLETPYTNLKCCGMGAEAKKTTVELLEKGKMKYEDFRPGYEVDGNLKAKQIIGGTLLVEQKYKMH